MRHIGPLFRACWNLIRTSLIGYLPWFFVSFHYNNLFAGCKLGDTDWIYSKSPAICLDTLLNVYDFRPESNPTRNHSQGYGGEVYAGLYLQPKISAHFWTEGLEQLNPTTGIAENQPSLTKKAGSGTFVSLGHPETNPIQIAAGRFRLPFGVGSGEFSRLFTPDFLRSSSSATGTGFMVSGQPSPSTSIELAVTEESSHNYRKINLRGSRYFSLLRGTRLTGSYGQLLNSERRELGLALMIFGSTGRTRLEWSRTYENTATFFQISELHHEIQQDKLTYSITLIYKDSKEFSVGTEIDWKFAENLGAFFSYRHLKFGTTESKRCYSSLVGLSFFGSFSKVQNEIAF